MAPTFAQAPPGPLAARLREKELTATLLAACEETKGCAPSLLGRATASRLRPSPPGGAQHGQGPMRRASAISRMQVRRTGCFICFSTCSLLLLLLLRAATPPARRCRAVRVGPSNDTYESIMPTAAANAVVRMHPRISRPCTGSCEPIYSRHGNAAGTLASAGLCPPPCRAVLRHYALPVVDGADSLPSAPSLGLSHVLMCPGREWSVI